MHPFAHARSWRRAAWPVALGAIFAISAVDVPAAPAHKAKTSTAAKKAAPKSTSKVQHAADVPPYVTPPLEPGDTLLARVGDRTITLKSFRQEWASVDPAERPKAPEPLLAYKEFLNEIVTRELLGIEATRHARPLSAEQKVNLDSLWHIQARNQLFLEEVESRVTVDPTQVDRYRKQLSRILYLTAYVLPTQERAQAWYTRIVGGTPLSRLEAAAQEGGPDAPKVVDMGRKIREEFDENTADILFDLPPGRLSRPVPTAQGWALIKLTESRPRANSYAGGTDAGVLAEMRRIKTNSYKEVYRDSLAHALHIVYHEAAMDTLVNRFVLLPARAVPSTGGGMQYRMNQSMPAFQAGDADLVLATTDRGRVTGADLYRFLLGLGAIARPEIRNVDQLRSWVDRVAFDAALLHRAVEMGYDKKPRVLREVAKAREFDLVSNLYEDSVTSKVHVTDAEVRALYDADPSRWKLEETATMWVCCVPTRAKAESLITAGKAGGNLKQMAYDFTLLDAFAENGGMTQPFTRATCPVPEIADSVFRTPIGSYGGPIVSSEGWNIFKVLGHTPARSRSFEEVKDDAKASLQVAREEETMQLFLGRLRKRIPVEKHEERLAQLPGASVPRPAKS